MSRSLDAIERAWVRGQLHDLANLSNKLLAADGPALARNRRLASAISAVERARVALMALLVERLSEPQGGER